jgi:hypothetical protein
MILNLMDFIIAKKGQPQIKKRATTDDTEDTDKKGRNHRRYG